MDTDHPSRKLSNLDEPDMRDTAGEVGTNLLVTYSCGPLHMDEQRQDDQLEPTYNSSVPIKDVALKIYRMRWTIVKGGGRGSGKSVLMAPHDDDDDDNQSRRKKTLKSNLLKSTWKTNLLSLPAWGCGPGEMLFSLPVSTLSAGLQGGQLSNSAHLIIIVIIKSQSKNNNNYKHIQTHIQNHLHSIIYI